MNAGPEDGTEQLDPHSEPHDAFKKAIKDKGLESYRNGQRSRPSSKETEPTSEQK